MDYNNFLSKKEFIFIDDGIKTNEVHPALFNYQKDIVRWALKKGRAAIFANCGLGKTMMQLEWAKHVNEYTKNPVLILAPLAVSSQTILEAVKLGINVSYATSQESITQGINITNYERLDNFNLDDFGGIVLDESSIIKSFTGKIRNQLLERTKYTKFKLACTATPSPNDFMELGNHAEFVGAMSRTEMLSMFFVHDGGETSKWRIKGHAKDAFWKWVCSWAVMINKPSDLGYSDKGFELPPIEYHQHTVMCDNANDNNLFQTKAQTLQERIKARGETILVRAEKCAEIVNATSEPFLIWCDRNGESTTTKKLIANCIEITGSDKPDKKEKALLGFANGEIQRLVTKPKIAGFGLNWQSCNNIAFLGLSDSYESFYQAVRRCWRFGQKKKVNVHIIISEREGNVLANIMHKEQDDMVMRDAMIANMAIIQTDEIHSTKATKTIYNPGQSLVLPSFIGN